MRVDISFLILVVAPLSVYLVIILFTLQDIEPSGAPAQEPSPTEPATAALDTALDVKTASLVDSTAEPVPDAMPAASAATVIQDASVTPDALPSSADAERALTAPAIQKAPTPVPGQTAAVTAEPAVVSATEQVTAPADSSETFAVSGETFAAVSGETFPGGLVETVAGVSDETLAASVVAAMGVSPAETVPTAPDNPIIAEPPDPASEQDFDEPDDQDIPDGPLQFPEKGSPKFTFDYRGRLWVEKKNKGFFKQLRRPQLPPDEPGSR